MNVISLEFNFADYAFVTLLQCTAKMFSRYLILQKQFIWVIPCQLIHFFADPSPILMKFGKLGGQQKKLIHTKFQHISTIFNGVRAL